MTVAVVGAGIAGLSCAVALREAGIGVVLFDKGRAPGGRVATRRRDGLVFNHGAQYATARTEPFRTVLHDLAAQDGAAVWTAAGGHDARWTGMPGMSVIPRALADGLTLHTERHVLFLHPGPDGWRVRHGGASAVRPGAVRDTGGELAGPFTAVAVALPSPQAAPLLAAAGHAFAGPVAEVVADPCWAVMFATDAQMNAKLDAPDFGRPDEGPIATAARDSARPGRAPGPECWMLHATPDWSREHLERNPDDVSAMLLAAFSRQVGAPIHARGLSAHRWRYSQTRTALGQLYLWDEPGALGVCGDWCLGGRVEGAFTSGRALAEAISGCSPTARA